MKSFKVSFTNVFLSDKYSLNGKIFNVLALAGFAISLAMTIISFFTGSNIQEVILNLAMALFALVMLMLHVKTGYYYLCSTITIIIVFIIVFPLIFFNQDGYVGGMPSFFVFAIVFTIYLSKGITMLILILMQYVTYIGISVFAYYHPNSILNTREPYDLMIDIVMGFVIVSLILGITMFIQFKMYAKQQRLLEQANIEAERANKAKTSFLANVSHEIRTPIGIILGTNELIARDDGYKNINEHVEKIKNAGELLDNLINNILDFVKIEADKTELSPKAYALSSLLEELEQYANVLARKKGLSFSFFMAGDINNHLIGDSVAIKQILLNIINNAVKYTDSGSVSLRAEKKVSDNPDEIILHFIVSDTGIGINQSEVDKIFDAFKRIDRGNGRYVEGVGLGLSIVKQLLTLMNGDIEVLSIHGSGSDFSVYIPQKIAYDYKPIEDETKFENSFIAPSIGVLIVDDNIENLLLFKALLERTLMRVDIAKNPDECFMLLRSNSYDIILMDYMMPDMNGIELLKVIKSQLNINIPAIAVTANALSKTRDELIDNGFNGFLTKPVMWQQLEKAILQFIPSDKYRLIELKSNQIHDERFEKIVTLKETLLDYGIDTTELFAYSGSSYELFCKTIAIYLIGMEQEIKSTAKLFKENNHENLIYTLHSLKSRAKNVGAMGLHHTASDIESLCKKNKVAEIEARMPYLLYQWTQLYEGLNLINTQIHKKDEEDECI